MRIGIDLGGTKTEVVVVDRHGKPHLRRRVPTPFGDYEALVQTIVDLVHDAQTIAGSSASVGIGTPGVTSPRTGLMKNSNSTVLNGQPLQRDLEARLGRAVRMSNDANCFILSEITNGAGADAGTAFGVIIGTGVGAGITVNGHIVEGRNAIAGEWGHNPLPWPRADELPGPLCYCGKYGCIETYLSGPGLEREYLHASGQASSAKHIAARAQEGDAQADAILSAYEDRLARALATVINLLDPDTIVLGGGLSNVKRLYTSIPRLLERYVFSDGTTTRIVQARHGDSSGVLGAAMLWNERIVYGAGDEDIHAYRSGEARPVTLGD